MYIMTPALLIFMFVKTIHEYNYVGKVYTVNDYLYLEDGTTCIRIPVVPYGVWVVIIVTLFLRICIIPGAVSTGWI